MPREVLALKQETTLETESGAPPCHSTEFQRHRTMAYIPAVALLALGLFAIICPGILAGTGLDEERLLTYLRGAAAHPLARPVQDSQEAVHVTLSLSIHGFDVDEEQETLYTNSWVSFYWKDFYLTWNVSVYNGLGSVRVPVVNIWHPDVEVYNSKGSHRRNDERAVLYASGYVGYVSFLETRTFCQLDLTYFPFDTHTCNITVGSWTYTGNEVNLTDASESSVVGENFSPNKKWKITEATSLRVVSVYDCCPEPYITITYLVTFQRAGSHFLYVYVGPVVILSVLGAVIFLVPPGSVQKLILGGTLLICFGLYFLDIGQILPPVHLGTLILDKYYMATYAMLAVSVFLSALITNLARRSSSNSHPPACIKRVILGYIGRLVCLRYTSYMSMDEDSEELSDIKTDKQNFDNANKRRDPYCHIKDWVLIARVLDRLFLIVYILMTVLVTIVIFLHYATM